MAAKSKNIYDVYTWIKDYVIPSINHPLQERSVRNLIDNFRQCYSDHVGYFELYGNLSRQMAYLEYPYTNIKDEQTR